jgi:hypothetical protein
MPVTEYMSLDFIVLEKQHLAAPTSSVKCEKSSISVDYFSRGGKLVADEAL